MQGGGVNLHEIGREMVDLDDLEDSDGDSNASDRGIRFEVHESRL